MQKNEKSPDAFGAGTGTFVSKSLGVSFAKSAGTYISVHTPRVFPDQPFIEQLLFLRTD